MSGLASFSNISTKSACLVSLRNASRGVGTESPTPPRPLERSPAPKPRHVPLPTLSWPATCRMNASSALLDTRDISRARSPRTLFAMYPTRPRTSWTPTGTRHTLSSQWQRRLAALLVVVVQAMVVVLAAATMLASGGPMNHESPSTFLRWKTRHPRDELKLRASTPHGTLHSPLSGKDTLFSPIALE